MKYYEILTFSEIYYRYWEDGFWYEKVGAILLWMMDVIIIISCFLGMVVSAGMIITMLPLFL